MPCFEASRSTAPFMAANSDHRPSHSYRALTLGLISAVSLVLGSGVAHASTLAHFSCQNYSSLPGAAQPIDPTDVTANVSAFDIFPGEYRNFRFAIVGRRRRQGNLSDRAINRWILQLP
jgi:hypothetical protein